MTTKTTITKANFFKRIANRVRAATGRKNVKRGSQPNMPAKGQDGEARRRMRGRIVGPGL